MQSLAAGQQQQRSNQVPQNSNQAPQQNKPIEYCQLGSLFEPLIFPIGNQSFKIDFDLRINLGRTHEYETVLVDCEPKLDYPSDYPLIFESGLMLRFTKLTKFQKFTLINCWLILQQALFVNGTLIHHRNNTHIEYCRHIDINFGIESNSNPEMITIRHHTSLLDSIQEPVSMTEESISDANDTSEETRLTNTIPIATPTMTVESEPLELDAARRRRSLNSSEDACYEISIVHFEISFDMETSKLKIKDGSKPIFSKILDIYDRRMIGQELEIYFHAHENFFADVSKIRYESIPTQFSSLPKRNNESH